jgi:hypothetical protein
LCRSNTRAEVGTGSAVSANREIAICDLFTAGALAVIRYAKIHGTSQPSHHAECRRDSGHVFLRLASASRSGMRIEHRKSQRLQTENELPRLGLASACPLCGGRRRWRLRWSRGRRLRWPRRQHGATYSGLWPSSGGMRADHPIPSGVFRYRKDPHFVGGATHKVREGSPTSRFHLLVPKPHDLPVAKRHERLIASLCVNQGPH